MKNPHAFLIAISFLFSISLSSQNSTDKFWAPVKESDIRVTGVKQIVPQKFLTFSLNGNALEALLFSAPHEKTTLVNQSSCIITLPVPNGTFQRFRVIESPIMAPELGAAFPGMKTFSVKGIDDAYASGKLDWTGYGFHGMILTSNGDFFIDPYCIGNTQDYITYYTADFKKDPAYIIPEASLNLPEGQLKPGVPFEVGPAAKVAEPPAPCVGDKLRTYRLAVACTGEYAKAATGLQAPTVAQTFSRIVTSINRVDGVYEKEVAVRMVLVATETLIIYTDPATDPFNGNNNAPTLINESQTVITNNIGSANFDIGHTFSTGGGGLANLGAVCKTTSKASGITGSGYPVGDAYDIDYVAHEMGHQFSGNHTFNAITGGCSGNRSGSTSMEPGSGVTIMAYAGLCPANNVANHSIPYFHAISYDEIVNYTNTGFGNSCAVTTTTGNHPPVVTGSAAYVIPKGTPFILTGSATDIDGDKLYYSWEETDIGAGVGGNWNSGQKPYFRSYAPDSIIAPATEYSRLFPKKSVVINGNYTGTIGEYVPQTSQTLNFRLTARDNKMGGGGVCYANSSISVDDAGPLTVNYPSATGIFWLMGSTQLLVWEVNGTDQAPVSCDTVKIWISYDSGNSYSILFNSTPNDGFENIVVPTLPLNVTTCRIKVESKGNIFYDISNNNFTITSDLTVGLNQISQNNPVGLNVWPNPFSGEVNFSVGNLNSKTATQVKVLDVLGKSVLEFNYSGKSELKESIDLSTLSNGVYFIKVSNDNNSSVHRLVKN